MVNLGFWIGFVLKTAKMKLPFHDLLIVKATAPLNFVILVSSDRYGNLVIKWMILIIFQFEAVSCKLVEIFYFWINP